MRKYIIFSIVGSIVWGIADSQRSSLPPVLHFCFIYYECSKAWSKRRNIVWHLQPECYSTVWACWRRKMVQSDQVTEVEAGGILALYLPSINMMENMNAWILSQVRFITTFIIRRNMFLSHPGSAGEPPLYRRFVVSVVRSWPPALLWFHKKGTDYKSFLAFSFCSLSPVQHQN